MFDLNHPFFTPLWRRVVVVAACLGWAGLELATGAPFWAFIFGALGVYSGAIFFNNWAPAPSDKDES